MKPIRVAPDASRAIELQAVVRAEREGLPFLIARDAEERQLLLVLEPGDERLWIGRSRDCDLALEWDAEVSRVHAELIRVAGDWAISDDGLSENGTFVDGERIGGRRRLQDGDVINLGGASLVYRAPADSAVRTRRAERTAPAAEVTPMQRKVLAALCRPLRDARTSALPATNRAIAQELVVSVETVKTHLRALFAAFDLEQLPQNEKRARLAEIAMRTGLAVPSEPE